MWTSNELAGASEQDFWNNWAALSIIAIAIVAGLLVAYLMFPVVFSRATTRYWEALLAPILVPLRWLGRALPAEGPWRRYTYQPRHLATA